MNDTPKLDDALILNGGAIKSLGDGRVGGYLVRFSTKDDPDLEGDFFTAETDFGPNTKSLVLYGHGQDKTVGKKVFDAEATMKADEVGIWVEAQLDKSDRYAKAILKLADDGKLGWSSGTAPHLVERVAKKGKKGDANWVKSWPLGLDASMTPCPVEPRTAAVSIKALALPDFDKLETKSVGPSQSDKGAILGDALRTKLRADASGKWVYAWIVDVFDATLVYQVEADAGQDRLFEAPYTFQDLVATIGEGAPVVRTTRYEPARPDPLDETKALNARVDVLTAELAALKGRQEPVPDPEPGKAPAPDPARFAALRDEAKGLDPATWL